MESSLWIVTSLGLLCWFLSWILFARLRSVPQAAAANPSKPPPDISIVIPARDEEDNIDRLLRSLNAQDFQAREVIVVDDQSGDETAERAHALGATVLAGATPPQGWLGKPWACQQGADAAQGSWLLFLDADTEFQPGGLGFLAALAGDERDVHSVCPYHRVRAPYEQLSSFFNVIMILGMNAFTAKGRRARDIGLFGQVMLISSRQYRAVHGHSLVKAEVLENFHLAHHLREAGAFCHCWLGKGAISMRMFPRSCSDLVAGWSKGIVSGAGHTARGALVGISIWLSGLFMSAIPLCFSPLVSRELTIFMVAVYLLSVLQVAYLFRKAGNFSLVGACLYPASLLFYQFVFFRALRRKRRGGSIQWKGRHVS